MVVRCKTIKTKQKNINNFKMPSKKDLDKYDAIRISYLKDDEEFGGKDVKFSKTWIIWEIEKVIDPMIYHVWIKASDDFYSYKHVYKYNEVVDFINETNKIL